MRSHEAAWVAELLILLPEVDVLSVRVDTETMRIGPDREHTVPVVVLDVHAATLSDAVQIAQALHLTEVDPEELPKSWRVDPQRVWHRWRGWAHEGSREMACRVVVDTAEDIPAEHQVAA
ncbi:hypothetical protein ACWZJV_14525 [Nocardioides sp. WG-D5]